MLNRRSLLSHSAKVAALLAAGGFLPQIAHAAYNAAAFEVKTMAELAKLLGGSAPTESKDVTITGPDIAENGAVVPLGVSSALPGVKRLLVLVEKNPSVLSAMFAATLPFHEQLGMDYGMLVGYATMVVAFTCIYFGVRQYRDRQPARTITFGRGVQVALEIDDLAFEGSSAFLLGCVLERFVARHVSMNGFTQTRVHSVARGDILNGRPRCGTRPLV
jgi:sulfur-oxidizing protein SoxY